MADTDDVKEKENAEDSKEQEKEQTDGKKASKSGMLLWIILAVAVLLCAAMGFGLGRLFAGSNKREPVAASEPTASPEQTNNATMDILDSSAEGSQKLWYYDLEPVVANLNEPDVTRYIRVALTLQISPDVDQGKGTAFLEEKKLLLANWTTLYLAGLSIEDIRGEKNLVRIQSQICDMFNERLFPNARGQIKNVLFREFAIQ